MTHTVVLFGAHRKGAYNINIRCYISTSAFANSFVSDERMQVRTHNPDLYHTYA